MLGWGHVRVETLVTSLVLGQEGNSLDLLVKLDFYLIANPDNQGDISAGFRLGTMVFKVTNILVNVAGDGVCGLTMSRQVNDNCIAVFLF